MEFLPPGRFDDHSSFKNLFLIAALDDPGPIRDRVRRIAGAEVYAEFERGERPFAIYGDVYATGQSVFIVAAPDRERLDDVLIRHADALYDSLEVRVRQGLQRTLYTEGEHPSLGGYLRHATNWTLRLPKMYEVEEDPVHSMIIMHTQSPERWLFVQSAAWDREEFTPERCVELRRTTPRLYEDEVLIDDVMEREPATFAGETGFLFKGRWQSPSFTVGGPFWMYAVHHGGRVYLVDFLVFLPSMDKLPYLRQLDAIANTFRFDD